MRKIESQLSITLKHHNGNQHVSKSKPFPAKNYYDLINKIAELAYLNKDYLLFFRGQSKEYINKTGASTFYPSIYRGAYVPQEEIRSRFINLYEASELLIKSFEDSKIQGYRDVKRKKYIQWSILQHYEICNTPLLDFTHSLRVASTFAQRHNNNLYGYVYVFAFPYITNRISINSEDDLVNIRLLSICPPKALRPYFQDGYLAGTEDISAEFDSKSELDFNNRLVAKFQVENDVNFWGRGFSKIPDNLLFPKKDSVARL